MQVQVGTPESQLDPWSFPHRSLHVGMLAFERRVVSIVGLRVVRLFAVCQQLTCVARMDDTIIIHVYTPNLF